jgi:hypothetical protein
MSSDAGTSLPAALLDADSQLLKDFGRDIMQDCVYGRRKHILQ